MQAPSVSLYIIALIITIICLGVYYLLKKLLPLFKARLVRYVFLAVTVGAAAIAFLNRPLFASGLPPIFSYFAVWWLISLLIMLPLLLFWRGLLAVSRQTGRQGLSRRDFICKSAAIIPLISVGFSAKGIYDSSEITVWRHSFSFKDFPKDLAPLKIVQISDTHIGAFFGMDSLERVLSLAIGEQPDVVVITGDLIDDLSLLDMTMERLSRFEALVPYGVYYCWGNHEYFRDQSKIRRAVAHSPLKLLENSSQKISTGERPFYFVGVDYPWAKKAEEMRFVRKSYLEKGLEGVPEDAFTVLLSHHPDFIEDAFHKGIPLTLAGHTHGGQVNIAEHSLLPVKYKYMRGLYREQDMLGYVSTGAGSWLPFRICCPAEIAVFTLSGPV